jgi:hypothetical protein
MLARPPAPRISAVVLIASSLAPAQSNTPPGVYQGDWTGGDETGKQPPLGS